MSVRHWARTQPFAGCRDLPRRHQLDYTIYWDELRSVDSAAASWNQDDPAAGEQLLPLVYDELRKLAAAKLAHEKPGQTLQATALVHEAYIRLVDVEKAWDSRGQFFAAAAESMRRILVDNARSKLRVNMLSSTDSLPPAPIRFDHLPDLPGNGLTIIPKVLEE
jgi:DNA-directed RNA polymerase specialized sigma24 family protein